MFRIFSFIKSVVLWSYDRGTWQYDTLVVLILTFIFFVPNSWFQQGKALQHKRPACSIIETNDPTLRVAEVPVSKIAGDGQNEIERALEEYLRKEGFNIARVERYEIVPARERAVGDLYHAFVRFHPVPSAAGSH